ncbi:MAG: alpha-amylase family protein [Armatimonadota bacterium]
MLPDLQKNLPTLDPNLTAFPESSIYDASGSLEAPAGKHGFVTVKDGHFVFSNTGQRVRFFGINLAKDSVFVEKAEIDRVVDLFARAGINLVRIHHIDDATGIFSPHDGQYFLSERLDKVDYWIAKLKARGIYVNLDLNDYRTFRAEDGVVNGEALGRGAKPYAVFNQRLIELQQEYARKFLVEHVNPYTGLSYAKDPAVAMLEIYDENGLFIRRGDWHNLRDPYQAELTRAWNNWLRKKYASTDTLRAAWTNASGKCALGSKESLEDGTEQLPRMDVDAVLNYHFTHPLLAPVRQSDGALFARDVQTAYMSTMMSSLRNMGVKVPITAVGAQDMLPDLIATAEITDYIGINYYWDHPLFDQGNEWKLPFYFALNNPLVDNPNYTFPVTVSLARMQGKPLVVRELGYCYPNPYRGVGMIEAAAYGSLLDIDAIILFTYGADSRSRTIGYFDVHLDPLRWGLVGQASRMFLSGAVRPAEKTVAIGYSTVDAFTWYQYLNTLYSLAFTTKVVNYVPMTNIPNPFDMLIASGRSCGSDWSGDRLLLFANNHHTDLRYKNQVTGLLERNGYQLQTGRSGEFAFTFNGMGYDRGIVRPLQVWPVFSAEDIMANGLMPVATSNTAALGFYDAKRKLLGFHNLRDEVVLRFALDAMQSWCGTPMTHATMDQGLWVSDTRQITRKLKSQLLVIDTPTLQSLAGQLSTPSGVSTSAVRLSTTTRLGTLTVESLEGKPLKESGSLLVKMTSLARNDQLQIAPAQSGPKPQRLTSLGTAPIRTDGRATATPSRVEVGGKLLIEVGLQNGTWEYLATPERAYLYLDTGTVGVTLPEKPKLVRWHTGKDVIDYTPDSTRLIVPGGVRVTEIVWEK